MVLLKKIGISPLSPRWLKILCLQLVMNEITSGFKKVFAKVDTSKITQEQRDDINTLIANINTLIAKMNKARGISQ